MLLFFYIYTAKMTSCPHVKEGQLWGWTTDEVLYRNNELKWPQCSINSSKFSFSLLVTRHESLKCD